VTAMQLLDVERVLHRSLLGSKTEASRNNRASRA
jgi:hypothetical protein